MLRFFNVNVIIYISDFSRFPDKQSPFNKCKLWPTKEDLWFLLKPRLTLVLSTDNIIVNSKRQERNSIKPFCFIQTFSQRTILHSIQHDSNFLNTYNIKLLPVYGQYLLIV